MTYNATKACSIRKKMREKKKKIGKTFLSIIWHGIKIKGRKGWRKLRENMNQIFSPFFLLQPRK